jgi:16S rRNA (uracil1498-N3)-methyltransferase
VPPVIRLPEALSSALKSLPSEGTRIALDPAGSVGLAATKPAASIVVAIGPEGGFSDADWLRLDGAAFNHVGLGPRILRAETAAFAVAAIAQALWGDYSAPTGQ